MVDNSVFSPKRLTILIDPTFRSFGERFPDYYLLHLLLVLLLCKRHMETQKRNRTSLNSSHRLGNTCISRIKSSFHWRITIFRKSSYQTAGCGPNYPEQGNNVVEKIEYLELRDQSGPGRVYINTSQYFDGVPHDVWEFHVGGYQVCQKWLKDRKGRVLSFDDIRHYQRIVAALAETITLMASIDEVIEEYGGWPIE
jgi:hypothetical protein